MSFTLTKLPEKKEEEPQQFTLTKPPEQAPIGKQIARGVGQGGLDFLSLASLPLYPIEKGLDLALGSPEYEGMNPNEEARYSKQFDILGKMQNEGYIPTLSELMDLSDDDFGTRAGTSLAALQKMQEGIPEGGILQEGVRRVTRSIPAAVFGPAALVGTLGAEATGMGAKEGVKALGGSEGWQTAADIFGGLAYGLKNLLFKSSPAKTVPYVAQNQGGIMQAIEKQAPHSLEKRIHSLGQDTIQDFKKVVGDITDKEIQQMTNFSAREIEDAIVKNANDNILNKITPQDALPQQAWKDIQTSANKLYEAEQSLYKPKYNAVRDAAKKIAVSPNQSVDMARKVLKKLSNVKTSPTGYGQTANIVRDVIHDLTGVSPNAEIIKSAMETGNTHLLEAIYDSLKESTKLTLDKMMDLSIRLNDAINYEALTPTVKDWLRPLQKTVKEELKETLKYSDPSVLKQLEEADSLYKRTAERFGKDSISSLRSTENPERMAASFSQPSNFENLVNLFGKNSQQVKAAERQIIGEIGTTSTNAAKDSFKQLEPFLSPEAKQAGKDIIALGDNLSIPGQRKALQRSMLEDVAESISTGQPPNFTTRAMFTPEGYQAAKDTFTRSASGKEVFKTLEKKLVSDIFDPIFVGDQVDWAKAAQILDNPNTAQVMTKIIGIDGVAMMKNMQRYGQNITKNLDMMKRSQPSTFNKLIGKMDSPTKLMLAAIVGKSAALPLWITGAVAGLALKRSLASLITNQSALKALKNMANTSVLSSALLKDVGIINESLIED